MNPHIPVLHVEDVTLAAAYEKALVALVDRGIGFRTQYDRPGDPLSVDCTMNITVREPLSDPMIHRAFPGGISDLREYVMELKGAKDHWVKCMNDPKDTRWEYTYHGRLERYGVWMERDGKTRNETGPFCVNQIQHVIERLAEQPFTRQAQMITWMPNLDPDCYDPPCLQSLWYRIIEDDHHATWWLNTNVRFRSNDAWGANFMNMFGFVMFTKEVIADELARRTGKTVRLARLNWHADSYHIYGKDIAEARQRLLDRIQTSDFSDRVYSLEDEEIRSLYDEAEEEVLAKIERYDREHGGRDS
jgi:thymidylate synthase